MKLQYLLPRLIRRFLPPSATRLLLRRGWFIRPGKETSDPQAALLRYRQALEPHGISWVGKRVLIFGYGGYFAVGCGLLETGASHVVLCDKYAPVDDPRNQTLLPHYERYLYLDGRHVCPRPEAITLLEADIRDIRPSGEFPLVDLVVSSDVFEHLEDVGGVTRALAKITRPEGAHIHFIDLRDHFFKYPFEMLCYSENVWRKWLDPGSHHNRYRLPDYQRVFDRYFEKVVIEVIAREEAAFEAAYPRIRAEFLTGDPKVDSVTRIEVFAAFPRQIK